MTSLTWSSALQRFRRGRRPPASRQPRDDVIVATEIMRGRGFPQADLVGLASESDAIADRLTEQQGLLLDASELICRMEIRSATRSPARCRHRVCSMAIRVVWRRTSPV